MSDEELSPIERLKQEMADSKGETKEKAPEEPKQTPAKKRKVNVKSTAKKEKAPAKKKPVKVAKKKAAKKAPSKKAAAAKKPAPAKKKPVRVAKKKTAKKAAPAKKATKKAAPKKAPAKKTTKAPVKASESSSREMVRDRKGDGLTPVERKIIKFIDSQDEPVSVVTIGRRMFGKDCPSEGENSFRTVRNGLRFPVKYGMVDMVKNERGLYKIGAAYKRVKGDLNKLADRYRARVAKERKAS